MTGWRCWLALRLAQSLVVAEGQFWWSLCRQDGIVGRVEGGRSEAEPGGSEYTRLSCSGLDRLAWQAKEAAGQVEVKVAPNKVTWHLQSMPLHSLSCF